MKQYIPGTHEHARRKFRKYYNRMLGGGEVLLEIEWPDGTLSYEPGEWVELLSAYKSDRTDLYFFARGQGRRKKTFGGVPVVQVYSDNAAVTSTESALAADRREHGNLQVIDEDGETLEKDDNGNWRYSDTDEIVATDGGELNVSVDDKVMDLAPPSATIDTTGEEPEVEFDYDGQAYSLKETADYDPNPVSTLDISAVMDYVRAAESDEEEKIKWMIIGVGLGFGLLAFTLVGMWFLGQIEGSGGGGPSTTALSVTTSSLMLLSRPSESRSITRRVSDWVSSVVSRGGDS